MWPSTCNVCDVFRAESAFCEVGGLVLKSATTSLCKGLCVKGSDKIWCVTKRVKVNWVEQ